MLYKIKPDCSKKLTVMLAYFSDNTIKGAAFSSSSSLFFSLQKQCFTEWSSWLQVNVFLSCGWAMMIQSQPYEADPQCTGIEGFPHWTTDLSETGSPPGLFWGYLSCIITPVRMPDRKKTKNISWDNAKAGKAGLWAEKVFSDVSSLSYENLHPVQPHIRLFWKITLVQGNFTRGYSLKLFLCKRKLALFFFSKSKF